MPRVSRAHWAGSRQQASRHFCAWREQASLLSTSPDTDRSRVATLCTLLLAVLFPAVLPSDPPILYLSAPKAVRQTDRYETFFSLISHHFQGTQLLEARALFPNVKKWRRGWRAVLERIDTLVFLRTAEHTIGYGTWVEVCQAYQAGKQVLLARMTREEALELIPYARLTWGKISESGLTNFIQVGYRTGA